MKILHTAAGYPPAVNGVSEVVRQISEELAQRGHEVHVATSWHNERRTSKIQGVQIHAFKAWGNLAYGMLGEIERYRHFVQTGRWDVMVNHALQIWTTDAIFDILDTLKFPKVIVAHGLSGLKHPGYQAYYAAIRHHLSKYDRMIGLSALNEDAEYCKLKDLPPPQVIPNGVNLAECSSPVLGLRKKWGIRERPWAVAVCNHTRQKAHFRLFQLWRRICQPDARLTIIGNPTTAERWKLRSTGLKGGCYYFCILRSLLSKGCVTLKTRLPRLQVVSAIKEADLMLLVSTWEAFPLVILEAMAAGTPWVSLDVGNVRELSGGYVVENVEQMSRRVNELLEDKCERNRVGEAGRAEVEQKYCWNKIVSRYEDLYFELVAGYGKLGKH